VLLGLVALARILVLSEGWTATGQLIAVRAMLGVWIYRKYVLTVAIDAIQVMCSSNALV